MVIRLLMVDIYHLNGHIVTIKRITRMIIQVRQSGILIILLQVQILLLIVHIELTHMINCQAIIYHLLHI